VYKANAGVVAVLATELTNTTRERVLVRKGRSALVSTIGARSVTLTVAVAEDSGSEPGGPTRALAARCTIVSSL